MSPKSYKDFGVLVALDTKSYNIKRRFPETKRSSFVTDMLRSNKESDTVKDWQHQSTAA